ncbi:unnamed protein product, partial [Arabidopsis halleri]
MFSHSFLGFDLFQRFTVIKLVVHGFNFSDLGNDISVAILSDQKGNVIRLDVYGSVVAFFAEEAQRGNNYDQGFNSGCGILILIHRELRAMGKSWEIHLLAISDQRGMLDAISRVFFDPILARRTELLWLISMVINLIDCGGSGFTLESKLALAEDGYKTEHDFNYLFSCSVFNLVFLKAYCQAFAYVVVVGFNNSRILYVFQINWVYAILIKERICSF